MEISQSSICQVALLDDLGKDATDAMIVMHPPWVMDKIKPFYIADLEPLDVQDHQISIDFRALNVKLHKLGFYESRKSFWVGELLKFGLLWIGMIYFTVYGNGQNWSYLVSALLASQLWHQAAFVVHDGTCTFDSSWPLWNFT